MVGVVKAARRARMREQAGEEVPAERRQQLARRSSTNALAPVRRSRSDWCRCQPLDITFGSFGRAHEARVIALAAADLLHGAAEQHHGVGRREPDLRLERELALARTELDLDRAQRQAERHDIAAHGLEDRLDLIEAGLGQILVALREQAHLGRARPARWRRRDRAADCRA